MAKTEHTPMMKQYLSIKEDYPDCFLFYRLGDFYELFFEDANRVAQILELTLTSRNKNSDVQVPMCGVPYHSAQRYINKLIDLGYKVAICEQVEDPKTTKGMVKREVVQVVTPGTVMEESAMGDKTNTYIGAILDQDGQYSLAYADLSTGEIQVTCLDDYQEVITEVGALQIKELVFLQGKLVGLQEDLTKRFGLVISHLSDFNQDQESKDLYKAIQHPLNKSCLSLLLDYLRQTQKRSLDHLQVAQEYETSHYLIYGQEARRNLELTQSLKDGSKKGTLLWLLDESQTAMGGRMLKHWLDKPLINPQQIAKRQDIVANLLDHFIERSDLEDRLREVYDLERLAGRVAYGTVNAKDLVQLKESLQVIPQVKDLLTLMEDQDVWVDLLDRLDPVPQVAQLIQEAIVDDPPLSITEGDMIKSGYNEELDQYLDAMVNGKQWIAKLQAKEREKTGIKNLKVGYNKVFGYYIEITKANLDLLEDDRYDRKQTLANAERFVTQELKEKEKLILEAEDKSKALSYELFLDIREKVKAHIKAIQDLAKAVAEIDVLQAFAKVSEKYNYVRPSYHTESQSVSIKEGRHPVVEKVMQEQQYVPNDVDLNDGQDILLITGPNMSGKSTYMRQLALTLIMGQMGCYVPAKSADLPIFDKVFTRIGAMDDLFGGQSTFMVEMNETNHALQNASSHSLLLFDEIGRGTATYDGMALAEAIIEYVHDEIGAKTLFSTHYHELTELEDRLDRLTNVHVGAEEEEGSLVFFHKVLSGPSDKSYGVQVAQLAGLPQPVIDRAGQVLNQLEAGKSKQVTSQPAESAEDQSKSEAQQLDLFAPEEELSMTNKHAEVIKQLQEAQIMNMTPIQALNFLNDLNQKLH